MTMQTPWFLYIVFWLGMLYLLPLCIYTVFFKKHQKHYRLHARNVVCSTIVFMFSFRQFVLHLEGFSNLLFSLVFISILLLNLFISDK